jgi:transcriptional regulator with XRE-family HTH domain
MRELAAGDDHGPAVPRLRLGTALRHLRETRSLRLEDVASKLGVAPSTLSRIETGKALTRTSYLRELLDLYGVADEKQREALASLARQGQRKSWWADHADLLPAGAADYYGLEASAAGIRAYTAGAVHGLLQTADYAAAACRASSPGLSAEDAASLAAIQHRRQELMLRDGREMRLVLDESALRRVIGSAETMSGQLTHLAEAAASDHVAIWVIPLAAAHAVLSPEFTLLTFDSQAGTAAAWTSGIHGQVTVTTRVKDVHHAAATFAALTRTALPPEESACLIRHLAETVQDTPH